MRYLLLSILLSGTALPGADANLPEPAPFATAIAARSKQAGVPGRTAWRISVAGLAAANALDMSSSWGKRELNGALAGPAGTFGGKGAAVKSGIMAGLVSMEGLMVRKHGGGRLYRVLSVVNFAAASAISAVAVRNYGIPGPPPAAFGR